MLRKSPATYKIPAQKTEDGKDVAEGTLLFDKETNALSICIGKKYNAENPAEVFTQPEMTDEVAADKKVKSKNQVNKIQPKNKLIKACCQHDKILSCYHCQTKQKHFM